jgi:manganese/zinc/iron transport system permease protein
MLAATFADRLRDLATFRDYNTWTPLAATALLGFSAGVVGVFMVLRRRALIGDVVGHSALPGILAAFLLLEYLAPGSGKSTPALLAGAFVSGILGAICVTLIDRYSRIKSDAALAIVLSIFYGGGVVLLSVAQKLDSGSQAGLKSYLSGKTASLVASDVGMTAGIAAVLLLLTLLLFKEWTLLCFDEEYAAALGRPVVLLDTLLIGLVAVVAIIGMKSVGLILVVALLIIPAVAARFWTDDIRWMAAISGGIGGFSGAAGVAVSSLGSRIAAGPTIVLIGSGVFLLSLFLGRRRGVLWRAVEHHRLKVRVGRQDLLRACYEVVEEQSDGPLIAARLTEIDITLSALLAGRADQPETVRKLARKAERDGLLSWREPDVWRLTPRGATDAARTTRNHRLWELYLIQYADVAPSHVHRDADAIEHVLDPAMIAELEALLGESEAARDPASPHETT